MNVELGHYRTGNGLEDRRMKMMGSTGESFKSQNDHHELNFHHFTTQIMNKYDLEYN